MSNFTERDSKLIEETVDNLSQHFDTVHVLATRYEGSDTLNISKGSGNWYARYGQMREWLLKADEQTKIGTRKCNE